MPPEEGEPHLTSANHQSFHQNLLISHDLQNLHTLNPSIPNKLTWQPKTSLNLFLGIQPSLAPEKKNSWKFPSLSKMH